MMPTVEVRQAIKDVREARQLLDNAIERLEAVVAEQEPVDVVE